MAESIKFSGDKYLDASGVWDRGNTQSAINDSKSSRTNDQLPHYIFGSSYAEQDAVQALKNIRNFTVEPFRRGSVIHIMNEVGGYHTYFIGSTDPDYFVALVLDFYTIPPKLIRYSNGSWGVYYFNLTRES